MPAPAKFLLGLACARQMAVRAGVLSLAELALPRLTAGSLPGKAKAKSFEAAVSQESAREIGFKPYLTKRQTPDAPTTFRQQDRTRMEKAIGTAYQLFREHGTTTARHKQLFSDGAPSEVHLSAFRRCLQARTRSAPALRSKLLVARRFLLWLRT